MPWTRGRRIALDVGNARIGVATCDPDGILATPVETIRVVDGAEANPAPWHAEVRRVLELAKEYFAVDVVIGIPTSLRGTDTASTTMARSFGAALESQLPEETTVIYTDERLTTVQASGALRQAGRNAKRQKSVIDQQAAVMILQGWIDQQRAAPDPQ